ncbi:hypothetical protein GBF38_001246 [Nibea albiflora]|uniref:Uncharacterized protein n=1 Tax=Nibea albiflora TaxID=240163 RepID=A0ACB7ET99_NIBAL|nr:hypothetical protein GBF38_001246 [Nibea albiflora]
METDLQGTTPDSRPQTPTTFEQQQPPQCDSDGDDYRAPARSHCSSTAKAKDTPTEPCDPLEEI